MSVQMCRSVRPRSQQVVNSRDSMMMNLFRVILESRSGLVRQKEVDIYWMWHSECFYTARCVKGCVEQLCAKKTLGEAFSS